MGCAYCATGRLGLLRSLNAWEIVEQARPRCRPLARPARDAHRPSSPQVRTVHLDLRAESASAAAAAGSDAASLGSPSPRSAEEAEQRRRRPGPGPRVHGVVFQGMGEPTNNLGAVLQAIAVLCEPSAQQVSASNVTVSTVGSSPDGIRALAAAAPRCRLALSVGSARPAVRGAIMPSERRHPLWGPVLDACVHHAVATGLQPLWAVTPLAGVNDTEADALALADLAREFERRTDGVRPRISIVPYNSTVPSAAAAAAGAGFGEGGGGGGAGDSTAAAPEVDPFSRTAPAAEAAFRNALRARGVFSHRRYSGGGDVGAACGQLAGAVSAGRALAGAGAAAAAGAEGGGGAGGEVVQSNWAGDWRGGVRDSGRPTLEGAYS